MTLQETATALAGWLALGYALKRAGLAGPRLGALLNAAIVWVALPALVLRAIWQAPWEPAWLALPLLAWLACGLGAWTAWRVALWRGADRPLAGAFALTAVFGNVTFLGYPIVGALLGPAGLPAAVLYDLPGATLMTNTLGTTIAATASGDRPAWRAIARRLATFPPLWALAAGLALRPWPMPPAVGSWLGALGALTTPGMLLAIGTALSFSAWRYRLGWVLGATGFKLLAVPAFVTLASLLTPLSAADRHVATLQAAMPTMFYALVLARVFGLDARFVVNVIVWSTLLSPLGLALWQALGA